MVSSKQGTDRARKLLFGFSILVFLLFLGYPLAMILVKAFVSSDGISLRTFSEVISSTALIESFRNSFIISLISAVFTTVIAFVLAFAINYTNISDKFKKTIRTLTILPMFLPTITYGFAIMYSFGKQGFWTQKLGFNIINIYGFNGLLIGYFIYTLPISFLLIDNGMKYIDRKYGLVSRLLKDSPFKTFKNTVLQPLKPTFFISVIQCFFLSFTDFGIPTSLGGKTELISKLLYEQMMGAIPDFNRGAVIAIFMLLPSIISVVILKKLEQNASSTDISSYKEIRTNRKRDIFAGIVSALTVMYILSIFFVIFVIPFVQSWPYERDFTLVNFKTMFSDSSLILTYRNSIIIALLTAALGTMLAYASAIFTSRKSASFKHSKILNGVASVVNTVPGMVLGIAYLLAFSGSSLQNTIIIIILCNIIHYFSTPYLMFQDSLSKLNQNWETTAKLLGDSWFKTVFKIVTPNVKHTIIEVFSYYFINSMVTVSAVIFIVSAKTMVITAKIKELQYYGRFNDIFILSLLILATNLILKAITNIQVKKSRRFTRRKAVTKSIARKS